MNKEDTVNIEKLKVDTKSSNDKDDAESSSTSDTKKTSKDAIHNDEEEGLSLKEVIKEQATEEEAPFSSNLNFKKILGGDILSTSAIRRQIWLVLLIAVFMILYISNRYSCQKKLIEIDNLTKELQDAKYKALSSSSQITEKSRESNVLNLLKEGNDSTLHIANQPPFIINIPEK